MPVIRTPAVNVLTTGKTTPVPDRNPPTYGTQFRDQSSLGVRVKVDDARLRQQFDGFDGLERPFALVPKEENGAVTWERHPLTYRGPGREGFYGERKVDQYELDALQNVDRRALEQYGVAVGLETNVGTLWAQDPGDNQKVEWK